MPGHRREAQRQIKRRTKASRQEHNALVSQSPKATRTRRLDPAAPSVLDMKLSIQAENGQIVQADYTANFLLGEHRQVSQRDDVLPLGPFAFGEHGRLGNHLGLSFFHDQLHPLERGAGADDVVNDND